MEPDPKEHKSRYDVSGNIEAQFVDAAQTVLVNKKGITDLQTLQILEEEALAKAYETLLSEVRTDTPMTCDLLRYIHQRVFGDLYEWAGRWRTVKISKGTAIWPPPDSLDRGMREFERDVLLKYPAAALRDETAFFAAAGEIQGEFLAIHPFREGNARTIKLVTDILAAQTGRPLLVYDDTEAGTDRYIDAARAASAAGSPPGKAAGPQ
ncbi:MAG: Fic family protein [Planctomycetes bacterium]|nr:Fic family protein [Planctomycetota bacterium]